MQTQFYVARDGNQLGPWTIGQILLNVQSGQLSPNDYLYDEGAGDWIALMAHPGLAEALKEVRPQSPVTTPETAAATAVTEPQAIGWYVLKDENRFGPFALTELVKMLQAKSLFEFDFVWRPGLSDWVRVSDAAEFSPEEIRNLRESQSGKASEVFFRRRHARVNFGASLLIHDNARVLKAKAIEISAGGAALTVEGHEFEPGQTLFLHFKPGDGVPSFNATCMVVNKVRKGRDLKKDGFKYGVKFTVINPRTRDYIDEFANRKTRASAAA